MFGMSMRMDHRREQSGRRKTRLRGLVVLCFTMLLPTAHGDNELKLNKAANDLKSLHGEPQVRLDCASSNFRIEPCENISRDLWQWFNDRAYCISAAYSAALEREVSAQAATIFCDIGVHSDRRTRPGGRWSQHRYRRACDGNRIVVDSRQFNYLEAVEADRSHAKAKNLHYRFFTTFLDCWGTLGLGIRPDGGLTIDFNRGVRDWREDPEQHSQHYHLSRPCLTCKLGEMAYE
jgi:hypothetical protein